jgi:hypothetical protein
MNKDSAPDPAVANFLDDYHEKLVKITAHPEIPVIPEAPEIEDIEFISFTLSEIKRKTDDELNKILSGEFEPDKHLSSSMQALITTELISRSTKKASKPKTRLLKNLAALIIFIATILWAISEDVVKEKLNPFISSFINRIVAKYPLNNDNADHSHSNPIEVTGTVETSKSSNRVSAHDNDPDK